jgi:hypothetical protein
MGVSSQILIRNWISTISNVFAARELVWYGTGVGARSKWLDSVDGSKVAMEIWMRSLRPALLLIDKRHECVEGEQRMLLLTWTCGKICPRRIGYYSCVWMQALKIQYAYEDMTAKAYDEMLGYPELQQHVESDQGGLLGRVGADRN